MSGGRIAVGIAGGFAIWGSALIAAYAVHALGCAFDWPLAALRVALAIILFAHAAAVAALMFLHRSGDNGLAGTVARWTLVAGLVALLVTIAPGLVLTACV